MAIQIQTNSKIKLVAPRPEDLSKKGRRLLALLRTSISHQVDYRVTCIMQNRELIKCPPKGEHLKRVLSEGIRYMYEEKLSEARIKSLNQKSRRLLDLFKRGIVNWVK